MIISLNGMDNSGKSTQALLLLKKDEKYIKKLHIKDTPSFDLEKFNFDWWFSSSNALEFTTSIYKCIKERNQMALNISKDDNIVIYDKGNDFYDMRIIATLIMKGMSYKKAKTLQQMVKEQMQIESIEDLKIYLKPGDYEKKESFESTKQILYNAYLQINEILLNNANIDYLYIEPGTVEEVTENIEKKVEVMKNGKQKVHKN